MGVGVVEPPNLEKLIEDVGQALGKWTYLARRRARLPRDRRVRRARRAGRDAVMVGGVVAGQGQISLTSLIAIVWACAVPATSPPTCSAAGSAAASSSATARALKITEERLD